jgi:hypothetical protein
MIKWIKVTDRRPNINQIVLCYNDCEHPDFRVLTLKYEGKGRYYDIVSIDDDEYENRGWYEEQYITHWAELPNTPDDSCCFLNISGIMEISDKAERSFFSWLKAMDIWWTQKGDDLRKIYVFKKDDLRIMGVVR